LNSGSESDKPCGGGKEEASVCGVDNARCDTCRSISAGIVTADD